MTAVEIWDDTEGRVDAMVGGIGTGLDFGIGAALKERTQKFVVGVEPARSSVVASTSRPTQYSGDWCGVHPQKSKSFNSR